MAVTVAVSNQKGGVGKTTTAIHVAAALALSGQRTLLIDLDSQANATTGLGVEEATDDRPGAYHAIAGDEVAQPDWCRESVLQGLQVLPASLHLAGIDLEIGEEPDALGRLSGSVRALSGSFDWIIVDCPPSLGILSVNALAAADIVLTPLPPERFAIDGLTRLQATMTRLREAGRIKVAAPTIMLTRTQPWSETQIQRSIALRNEFQEQILVAEAPLTPALENASDTRRPVFMDAHESAGGDAYLAAAAELMLRQTGERFGSVEVMATVDAMKAEIERRWPRPDMPERTGDFSLPSRPSWISRKLTALRHFGNPARRSAR